MTLPIAELNDAFRRNLFGGDVYLTRGISALPISVQEEIIGRVRRVTDVTSASLKKDRIAG
jgi:hypothetical protein